MNNDSLRVHQLTKSYTLGPNEVSVLVQVDIAFPPGALITIQGASGSGKSTLLHVLGGLEPPQAGEVLWGDSSIYAWPRAKLADWRSRSVGFVFQSYHLLPELSAFENVELAAMIRRRPDPAISRKLLESVGLGNRLHHRPSELSGGERQRVAIARALRNQPALLLADEPTGNLDQATAVEIMELLVSLQKANNVTLILVTHDDVIATQGQHRLALRQGSLKAV
jgi:putative ABC transport system ATP-binding protein/lipoprotein-releasing system ATP-binding protein